MHLKFIKCKTHYIQKSNKANTLANEDCIATTMHWAPVQQYLVQQDVEKNM